MTNVRRGFTLVEMTIVLFIISLLILIILPNLNTQRQRAGKIHGNAMTTVVQGQVTAYLHDHPLKDNQQPHVTFADLKAGHYLTAQQVARAQQEQIVIKGDQALAKEK